MMLCMGLCISRILLESRFYNGYCLCNGFYPLMFFNSWAVFPVIKVCQKYNRFLFVVKTRRFILFQFSVDLLFCRVIN